MSSIKESFDLEILGQRLATLEAEKNKLKRGPLCDALKLIFFDVLIKEDGNLEMQYRSPEGEDIFGSFPTTFQQALDLFHPSDKQIILELGESFVRIRMRDKCGNFSYFFIKCIMLPNRWVGVLFDSPSIAGFGPTVDTA